MAITDRYRDRIVGRSQKGQRRPSEGEVILNYQSHGESDLPEYGRFAVFFLGYITRGPLAGPAVRVLGLKFDSLGEIRLFFGYNELFAEDIAVDPTGSFSFDSSLSVKGVLALLEVVHKICSVSLDQIDLTTFE